MIEILTGFFDIMRCGIVHRDFKPQNVLINMKKLKIGDFGLARSAGELMSTQVGTPVYESPQILNGEVYSSKCDIWALGLVFYQVTPCSTIYRCFTTSFLGNTQTSAKNSTISR